MTNKFEKSADFLGVIFGKRVKHIDELRFVNFNLVFSILLIGLRFCQTYRCNWRMRENNCGDIIVVHLEICAIVKYSLSYNAACFYSYWSQLNIVSGISNGIDSWNISVLKFINFNASILFKD
jgi:hypothetical protein